VFWRMPAFSKAATRAAALAGSFTSLTIGGCEKIHFSQERNSTSVAARRL